MLTRLSPYGQAVIMALLGYFFYSVADVLAKLLSVRHPISLCLFIPAMIALTGISMRITFERGWARLKSKYIKIHLMRGVVISSMIALCVNALKLIPIADFYCIIFLSPFIVMTLSVIIYKEALHWPRVLVLILSFAGVLITIGPHFKDMNIGYIFVGASIFFGAFNVFLVRQIGKDEYMPLFGLFPVLGIALFSAPFAIPELTTNISLTDMGLFLIYGLVLIGAHNFLPMAFARTPSVSRLTPLHYSQMVWGILAGFFIFDTPTEINTLLGGGLIVASGLWLFYYETFSSKKTV